jgi:hypothetical protein
MLVARRRGSGCQRDVGTAGIEVIDARGRTFGGWQRADEWA